MGGASGPKGFSPTHQRRFGRRADAGSVCANRVSAQLQKRGSKTVDTLKQVLIRLEADGSALGHFNISDLVMLKAVVGSAVQIGAPVIVGASEGEREFMGVGQLAAVVGSLREEFDTPIFLNADHTHSLQKVVEAAKAGFDAIVIDFSGLPFEQNAVRTKEAVEAIKAINPAILAEGEIGEAMTAEGVALAGQAP